MKKETILVVENMSGGAYRKAIYQCFRDVTGRELTDNEHKYLSRILKLYVDSQVKRTYGQTTN